MDGNHETGPPRTRGSLVLLSTAAGFLVFFSWAFALGLPGGPPPSMIRVAVVMGGQVAVLLGSLAVALALRRNARLGTYWRLAFAYFAASCAIVLSEFTGDWALALSGQAPNTLMGFAALKLGEDVAIIGIIIVLVVLTREKPDESFLSTGRLGLGLVVGIPAFVLLAMSSLSSTVTRGIPYARQRQVLPVFVVIALADGFMEERLFRGLFLRRLGRFVGDNWANLVTAVVFTYVHLQMAQRTGSPLTWLTAVFLMGLLLGWLMQRTRSILAPALVHAGVDMVILADTLAALAIRS